VSAIGAGTWAWGNQFLWGYDPAQDAELQKAFDVLVKGGVNFLDTADSYGTGALEGRSEKLIGQFCAGNKDATGVIIASKFAVRI
jgi:pyridoxine 4-dehydrogenase